MGTKTTMPLTLCFLFARPLLSLWSIAAQYSKLTLHWVLLGIFSHFPFGKITLPLFQRCLLKEKYVIGRNCRMRMVRNHLGSMFQWWCLLFLIFAFCSFPSILTHNLRAIFRRTFHSKTQSCHFILFHRSQSTLKFFHSLKSFVRYPSLNWLFQAFIFMIDPIFIVFLFFPFFPDYVILLCLKINMRWDKFFGLRSLIVIFLIWTYKLTPWTKLIGTFHLKFVLIQ